SLDTIRAFERQSPRGDHGWSSSGAQRARGGPGPRPVVGDLDRAPRQPGPRDAIGREGRRSSGVVGGGGVDHDPALVPGPGAARVAVKPHASPVLHAIEYPLGQLDPKYLTTLREFGGLQSYPSRLKDPVPADFSTGSVGIGATAPIWSAVAHRYVAGHFDVP